LRLDFFLEFFCRCGMAIAYIRNLQGLVKILRTTEKEQASVANRASTALDSTSYIMQKAQPWLRPSI
jgi:hypothetical protein